MSTEPTQTPTTALERLWLAWAEASPQERDTFLQSVQQAAAGPPSNPPVPPDPAGQPPRAGSG
jgi:hypothetical protein